MRIILNQYWKVSILLSFISELTLGLWNFLHFNMQKGSCWDLQNVNLENIFIDFHWKWVSYHTGSFCKKLFGATSPL